MLKIDLAPVSQHTLTATGSKTSFLGPEEKEAQGAHVCPVSSNCVFFQQAVFFHIWFLRHHHSQYQPGLLQGLVDDPSSKIQVSSLKQWD